MEIIRCQSKNIAMVISKGYCTNEISVIKGYIEDSELKKEITFSIWDDIHIYGLTFDDSSEKSSISFDFEMDDPLYFPLSRLIGNDKEFVLDDDHTLALMKRYMRVFRTPNGIRIMFINDLENKENKIGVFIKNIGADPRSKITDDSIKKRLVEFFNDVVQSLTEEYHQITFDELLEEKRVLGLLDGGIRLELRH